MVYLPEGTSHVPRVKSWACLQLRGKAPEVVDMGVALALTEDNVAWHARKVDPLVNHRKTIGKWWCIGI